VRRVLLLVPVLLFTLVGGIVAPSQAAPARHAGGRPAHLVTTWAASDDTTGGTLNEMTVRNIVRTSVGGTGLRIRVSNALGDRPVTFGSAYVGVQQEAAAIVPGTNRRLTFRGRPGVTVPAGEVVLSDPLPGYVRPAQNLAISLYLQGESGKLTAHNRTMQHTYKSTSGDHAASESAEAYQTQSAVWFWLDAVVVTAPRTVSTVAALGDSITSGVGSEVNANHRWTDYLNNRLLRLPRPHQLAVANEGISANRVLKDGVGRSAQNRLVLDVLHKPGVRTVILFEGVNDIGAGAGADELIAAYRKMIADAHDAGVCLLGGTITAFGGSVFDGDGREAVRLEVNEFIRNSGEFDGVLDFDAATRDPARPNHLLPEYSADGLHLSDAGYAAMANSVDLSALSCTLR
jgi:lysophospholipase L1-like esterase